MRCGICAFENQQGAQFCEDCGAKLVSACPSCGREVRPTAKFCPTCGLALTGQPADAQSAAAPLHPLAAARPEAERRQLTVTFCDLVGSTALSAQLDPEDLRQLVRQYQQTCAQVIQQHDGYLAQYLGDGLLVYFGYPTAHEDDARRAVRTGLEIVEELQRLNPRLLQPLQVRIGIHTGLVVIGDIGAGSRTEQLALGETPNVAARIQGFAEPNTVLISAATQRLLAGHFECQPFGTHLVKGIDTPIAVYHVQSERQSGSALEGKVTLTPLVGREQEVGLLYNRWEQVKEGRGQVVLLSGEPGIGKSRIAYTLREHITSEGSLLFEARCSPYHQHSTLYPLIDVLQRTLLFTSQDTTDEKVQKLDRALTLYGMQGTLPLFTALLSFSTPAQYPPLNLTPQKQKERTLQALVHLFLAQAERQSTVCVWEDVHWVDPSSLEFLTLLTEQLPTTKLLLVLTFRPEFTPPWKLHSHITQLTLNRLGKKQVETMIEKVTAGKALSAEIIDQIRTKTDGVPLFVEELTKSVIESVESMGSMESIGSPRHTPVHLAIPATLQEALLARLDRLTTARQIAQLGATLGREFSYELLQAVAPISESDVQTSLAKLVEAEILYHRGVGPQARYFFKHALIQDTAYQSLLKSARQQYHQQIARVLEEQFPDTTATQPELLAHHYTEAGLVAQAIPYWQRAGQRASERSTYIEAINHLTKGLELLKTLPDTPERAQQELILQIAVGTPLMATKGFTVPEVERVYARALELCKQVGDTPQLFPALWGSWLFYNIRGELQTSRELAARLLSLARSAQDAALLLEAHHALWFTSFFCGELTAARAHSEQGIALYDRQQHHSLALLYGGHDPGVCCRDAGTLVLWLLGYPDQAYTRSQEALSLARELSHPFSLGEALIYNAWLFQFRGEEQTFHERTEALVVLSEEQGFSPSVAQGTLLQGWALVCRGRAEEGIAQIRRGLTTLRATGTEAVRSYYLALLAEAYGKVGQTVEGLSTLTEALEAVNNNSGVHFYEAELHRLKGELTLQKLPVISSQLSVPDPRLLIPDPQGEAEACFFKAIGIAQKQQAKSLELRAATSLARLWQHQGKKAEARQMLAEIYGWFTEGFDTKDLLEAKALLAELSL